LANRQIGELTLTDKILKKIKIYAGISYFL